MSSPDKAPDQYKTMIDEAVSAAVTTYMEKMIDDRALRVQIVSKSSAAGCCGFLSGLLGGKGGSGKKKDHYVEWDVQNCCCCFSICPGPVGRFKCHMRIPSICCACCDCCRCLLSCTTVGFGCPFFLPGPMQCIHFTIPCMPMVFMPAVFLCGGGYETIDQDHNVTAYKKTSVDASVVPNAEVAA